MTNTNAELFDRLTERMRLLRAHAFEYGVAVGERRSSFEVSQAQGRLTAQMVLIEGVIAELRRVVA